LGAVAVPVVALALGGIAWAAWGVHGSGTTQAKAGTSVALVVVSAGISPTTLLYPGGTAGVVIRVRNDNRFPVTIGTVTRTSKPITTDAAHSGCPGSVLDTTEEDDNFDVTWRLAAGEDKTFTLNNAMRMDVHAGNACQGAAFSIPISISAFSG
jgi:hypothetical protein